MTTPLKLLKENAPEIFVHYVTKRKLKLLNRLEDLRIRYRNDPTHRKTITLEANDIKEELEEIKEVES